MAVFTEEDGYRSPKKDGVCQMLIKSDFHCPFHYLDCKMKMVICGSLVTGDIARQNRITEQILTQYLQKRFFPHLTPLTNAVNVLHESDEPDTLQTVESEQISQVYDEAQDFIQGAYLSVKQTYACYSLPSVTLLALFTKLIGFLLRVGFY